MQHSVEIPEEFLMRADCLTTGQLWRRVLRLALVKSLVRMLHALLAHPN